MSFVKLCFFLVLRLVLAANSQEGEKLGISTRSSNIVGSGDLAELAPEVVQNEPPPTITAPPNKDADGYQDRGCNANCRVRYPPVTVYEWQKVSITATSTIVKYIGTGTPNASPDSKYVLSRNSQENVNEFQKKNGVQYSALTVPVLDSQVPNASKSTVVDMFVLSLSNFETESNRLKFLSHSRHSLPYSI
jgi:hypothetical protein